MHDNLSHSVGFSIFFPFHSGLATRNIPNITEECQFVRVPAITNDACNADYDIINPNPTQLIDDSMICSLSDKENGTCTGDEGGPYICNINNTGQAVLVGVISWSNGCADPNFPGVYARVTHVLDWIKKNMVIL